MPVISPTPSALPSAPKPIPALRVSSPASASLGAVEGAGERRYITVMFCDLVGSTAISAQLDAEEWRDLVGAYVDAASAAVVEMGGHVAKKLGDGLMCLFGYPVVHENDAERAARTAVSIQRALAELNRKNTGTSLPALVARIGLESGPAVLDAVGEIYGDVANIAARVLALAEPGSPARSWSPRECSGRRAVCGGRAPHAYAQRRAGADHPPLEKLHNDPEPLCCSAAQRHPCPMTAKLIVRLGMHSDSFAGEACGGTVDAHATPACLRKGFP